MALTTTSKYTWTGALKIALMENMKLPQTSVANRVMLLAYFAKPIRPPVRSAKTYQASTISIIITSVS